MPDEDPYVLQPGAELGKATVLQQMGTRRTMDHGGQAEPGILFFDCARLAGGFVNDQSSR